jgi:hypothetical protein
MKQKTKAILIDILGFTCIIAAPFLGWLPGPGGIPLVILGLSLLANNHEWAERLMERVKEHTSNASKKVTEASPAMRWAIDILSVILIALAVILLTQYTRNITTTAAVSLSIAAIILFATNQNRYKKAWNKFFKKHKN